MTNFPPLNTNPWPYGYWQPVAYNAIPQIATNYQVIQNNVNLTLRLVVWVHKKCAKAHGTVGVWRHTKSKHSCYYCQKPLRGRKCGHPDDVEEGTPCSFFPDQPVRAAA